MNRIGDVASYTAESFTGSPSRDLRYWFRSGSENFVIAPNVRGSTGYGMDFQRANYQDLGGGDLQDEVYAAKFLQSTGYVVDSAGEITGFGVLDPVAGEGHRLNDDSHGYDLAWLPDQKRVAYFNSRDELVVQDVETLVRRKATGTLPYPPETFSALSASADGRTLYYGARQTQSNIWMVRHAAPSTH